MVSTQQAQQRCGNVVRNWAKTLHYCIHDNFLYQKLELEENLHNFGKSRIIITLVNCQIFVRKRRQKHDVLLVSGKKLTSKTQCCNNVGLWSKKGRWKHIVLIPLLQCCPTSQLKGKQSPALSQRRLQLWIKDLLYLL